MRIAVRSSALTTAAIAGIGALAITSVAPVPAAFQNPQFSREISLSASVAPGALLAKALTNQLQNLQLQLPYIKIGVVDAPTAVVLSPLVFVGALGSGVPLLQSIGLAGGSITGQVSNAWNGLVTTDAYQIVPRFQNSLGAAVLAGIRIGEALPTGDVFNAIQTGRLNIYDALSQPLTGQPLVTTVPVTVPEVVGVQAVNVLAAVVLQSPSLLLLGYIDAPNAFYQSLAAGDDLVTAAFKSGARFVQGFTDTADLVGAAVETAITNIGNAIHTSPHLATTGTGGFVQLNASTPTARNTDPGTPQGVVDAKKNQNQTPTTFTLPVTNTPATTPNGSTTKVRPSFKAVVGTPGDGADIPSAGKAGAVLTGAVKQVQSTIDTLGDQVKKVADDIKKATTPPGGGDATG